MIRRSNERVTLNILEGRINEEKEGRKDQEKIGWMISKSRLQMYVYGNYGKETL